MRLGSSPLGRHRAAHQEHQRRDAHGEDGKDPEQIQVRERQGLPLGGLVNLLQGHLAIGHGAETRPVELLRERALRLDIRLVERSERVDQPALMQLAGWASTMLTSDTPRLAPSFLIMLKRPVALLVWSRGR